MGDFKDVLANIFSMIRRSCGGIGDRSKSTDPVFLWYKMLIYYGHTLDQTWMSMKEKVTKIV